MTTWDIIQAKKAELITPQEGRTLLVALVYKDLGVKLASDGDSE